MPRRLFARGAQGELVRGFQGALLQLGFAIGSADGVFGRLTENAVRAFQVAAHLPVTGEVSDLTWTTLTRSPVPKLQERCISVTAVFEGHGFTVVQGNFDGAGMTWGIIGFTLKHGALGRIILRVQQEQPELLAGIFGDDVHELLRNMRAPVVRRLAWADGLSLGTSKVRIAEPWGMKFRHLGEQPLVQRIQLELADHDYFQPALKTAKRYQLETELGVALAFDIQVQNGGISPKTQAQINAALKRKRATNEGQRRVIIANAVADNARARYREDVRRRKLAFARGTGRVHGIEVRIRDWGLDEVSAVLSP